MPDPFSPRELDYRENLVQEKSLLEGERSDMQTILDQWEKDQLNEAGEQKMGLGARTQHIRRENLKKKIAGTSFRISALEKQLGASEGKWISDYTGETEKELLDEFARIQAGEQQPAPAGSGPHVPRVTFRQEPIGPSTGLEDRVEKELLDEFARIQAGEQQPAPAGAPVGPKLEPGALAAAKTLGLQVPSGALLPTGPGVQQQPPESTHPRFQQYPPQVAQAPSVPPEVVQHPISSYPSGTDLESRGIAPDEFRGRQATPAELARQAGAFQAAVGAQLDQAHAAGEKSGYGTEPYAVRNNMIVDPLPLSERPVTQRDQDAAQRGRDMAMNQFKAGRGDPSWSDEGYEGKEGTGPRFNWSTASEEEKREYVDLQRQIGGVSGRDDRALDMPAITGGSESYLPPERYKEREARAKELYASGDIRHPSLRAMDKYDRAQQRQENLAQEGPTRFKKAQVRGAQRALRGANTKEEKLAALSLLPGDVLSDPVALAAFDPSGKMASAALKKQAAADARAKSEREAGLTEKEISTRKTAADAQAVKANAEADKLIAEGKKIGDTTMAQTGAMSVLANPNTDLSSDAGQRALDALGIAPGRGAKKIQGIWTTHHDDPEKFKSSMMLAGYSKQDINRYGRIFYKPGYDDPANWVAGGITWWPGDWTWGVWDSGFETPWSDVP